MIKLVFVLSLVLVGCASLNMDKSGNALPLPEKKVEAIRLELKNPPLIGTTPAGQRIYLGGFSGLRYLGENKEGKLRFLTHTDRGPNTAEKEEGGKIKRPFLLPGFQPRLIFLLADLKTNSLTIEKEVPLLRPDGKKLSGIPQQVGQEEPRDSLGKPVALDPYGMDLEGVAVSADGSFWMVEEYGPTVARFSLDGKLRETLKPGRGLPKVLEQRRLNRGFEGAAIIGHRLYAILQSPLDNPQSADQANSKKSSVVRIIDVDLLGRRTLGQYIYLLDAGADRVGDVAVESPGSLLVIEQDGKSGSSSFKKIFRAELENATNLQLLPERLVGPGGALEGMSLDQLAEARAIPSKKELVLDLAAAGIREEKVEGIDLVENQFLAVAIDNDFGLNGELDASTGLAGVKEEKPAIYLFPKEMWKR